LLFYPIQEIPMEIPTATDASFYPLVMTNSSPWYTWPLEIAGVPINTQGVFHGELLNNQMVNIIKKQTDKVKWSPHLGI
jgi:hypothetical protein